MPCAAQLVSFSTMVTSIAGLGRIQGRGHAGDAAADHQNLLEKFSSL
jgi:hypothetical protein